MIHSPSCRHGRSQEQRAKSTKQHQEKGAKQQKEVTKPGKEKRERTTTKKERKEGEKKRNIQAKKKGNQKNINTKESGRQRKDGDDDDDDNGSPHLGPAAFCHGARQEAHVPHVLNDASRGQGQSRQRSWSWTDGPPEVTWFLLEASTFWRTPSPWGYKMCSIYVGPWWVHCSKFPSHMEPCLPAKPVDLSQLHRDHQVASSGCCPASPGRSLIHHPGDAFSSGRENETTSVAVYPWSPNWLGSVDLPLCPFSNSWSKRSTKLNQPYIWSLIIIFQALDLRASSFSFNIIQLKHIQYLPPTSESLSATCAFQGSSIFLS